MIIPVTDGLIGEGAGELSGEPIGAIDGPFADTNVIKNINKQKYFTIIRTLTTICYKFILSFFGTVTAANWWSLHFACSRKSKSQCPINFNSQSSCSIAIESTAKALWL